jgi:hypothetical protein
LKLAWRGNSKSAHSHNVLVSQLERTSSRLTFIHATVVASVVLQNVPGIHIQQAQYEEGRDRNWEKTRGGD